jgi:uncharacterized membrane protein
MKKRRQKQKRENMKPLMLIAITFLILSFGWAIYIDISGDNTALPLAYFFFILFLLITYSILKKITNNNQ